MPHIYKLTRAGIRLIYKIRHHRGHGIHSPFVYGLIHSVIEEKLPYYAYQDIEKLLKNCIAEKALSVTNVNRMTFRMVNHFRVRRVLEIGSGRGVNTLFLTAPSMHIKCICYESDPLKYGIAQKLYKNWDRTILLETNSLPDLSDKPDCIFIDLYNCEEIYDSVLEYIEHVLHEESFIIVNGIRTNRRSRSLWKDMKMIRTRTAALDLFHVGILFFSKSLSRWDYQISF